MRIFVSAIVVSCALLVTTRAEAAHVRATVLVASPNDRALTERVRGQTSDLDAEISESDARSVPPGFDARLREADVVGRRHAANAVIWFRVTGGAVAVHVAIPAQDRVLVRTLGAGAGKPSSATLEAAALVVRDVLRALGQGATVGELRERRADTGADARPDADADAAPPLPLSTCADAVCVEPTAPLALAPSNRTPVRSPRPRTKTSRGPAFVSSVGFQAVRARDAPSLFESLDLRLGLRGSTFSSSLVLTLGTVDVERVTERADLLVRRHSLGLALGATRAIGRDAFATLGLTGGAMLFVRSTRSLSPTFTPTATDHHVRAFVGPEARVAFSIAPPLAVVLTLGVDVVVNAPQFDVLAVSGRSAVYGFADVQPRLGLGLEWSRSKIR